jgi:serine/threonine protein kinase
MNALTCRFRFQLGGGSFGTVYATTFETEHGAREPATVGTSALYAVKLLQPSGTDINIFLRNALREVCASPHMLDEVAAFGAKLPRLEDVFFFASTDGSPLDSVAAVFRKFTCDCGSWFKVASKLNLLGSQDVTHVMFQLLQAVYSLHSKGVAHRDIKPGNMLVDLSTGDIVLSDFGFVSALETAMLHKARMDLCTIDTRAPELCLEAEADGTLPVPVGVKSDMWSVGITLLCALLGRESQPLGVVAHMEGDKKMQQAFLRARFSGTFAPLGPDPGPHPTTVMEWLARVLGATTDLPKAAAALSIKLTMGQALVLTQCLRLNPAERPSAQQLLSALSTNEPRTFDPDKLAALLPIFAKHSGVLQARAEKAQADNTMPVQLVIRPQSLLDGKKYAPGQPPPAFKASPFRGIDDRGTVIPAGQKERVRTLLSLTVMLRCVHSAERKAAATKSVHARAFRLTDTLLTAVELFDRLMSPAVLKRMRSMTETAIETATVGGEPLKTFLTDKLVDDSWTFERRDLQIISIFMADLLLHFDGHNLRRVLYTAYPRKCNIFTSECAPEAQDVLWDLKTQLLVQWILEAARSLNFDVVDGSLLRRLERLGCLHRTRSFVLGLFKTLETTPAQLVDLGRVEHHKDPLDWGFSATGADGTRGLFDVDF